MLTPAGRPFVLAPEFVPAPPALPAEPPEPPLPSAPFAEPPGVPARVPSGEMATRAERFPWGTLTSGAGGPGVAEIAIRRCKLSSPAEAVAPITGAAPASACTLRWAGAEFVIGFTGNFGCACSSGEGAIFNGPAFRSGAATLGAATSLTARCCIFGATTDGAIFSCGWGAGEVAAHSAMLGICGTIFGGAAGASG